jgi:hypothetical protein
VLELGSYTNFAKEALGSESREELGSDSLEGNQAVVPKISG